MRNNNQVLLSEQNEVLYLHLGGKSIQSAMSRRDPTKLVLSYTQAMVAVLLFRPHPKRILHIGLGGGALLRWFAAHYPKAHQIAVEINPQIIHVARTMFGLPEDSRHITVIENDGAKWIADYPKRNLDLILVDAFNGDGLIEAFEDPDFFLACRERLSPDGALVFNWWQSHARLEHDMKALKEVFHYHFAACPASVYGNIAVMAFSQALILSEKTLEKRARSLTEKTGVDFLDLLTNIRRDSRGEALFNR